MDFSRADRQLQLQAGVVLTGRSVAVSDETPPRFSVNGKLLHSRFDPRKEAHQQIGSIDPAKLVICAGAGLGFSVQLFLARGCTVIWFEPNLEILRYALSIHDFGRELESSQLRLLTTLPEESDLSEILRGLSVADVRLVSHKNFSFDEHLKFEHRVHHFLNKKGVNIATLSRFDRLWARNFSRNLFHLRRAKPVRLLFESEKGKPAVLASAGPSLNDSLEELARNRTRVVLIAVDTAVRVLTEAGLDPDYILSVDPQPVNRVYLEGYTGNARIVVDPTVSSGALRDLKNLYFFWSPFKLAQIFFDLWGGSPGEIAFGGSVATNAYDFARKLGCDPVYLIGQDLAFSDGQVHAKGAVLEERLNWRESRIARREGHNRMQRAALPVLLLPGLHGRAVETNEKLLIFYRWFERRFQRDIADGLRVVNATRRGAAFKAMEMGVMKAEGPELSRAAEPAFTFPSLDSIASAIQRFEDELGEVENILRDGLNLLAKESLDERSNASSHRDLVGLSDVEDRLREHSTVLDCLGLAAQRAILGITEGPSEVDGFENTRRLYTALHQAAQDYRKWFGKTLRVAQLGALQERTTGSNT